MAMKYNPAYHDDWAWSLAVRGATNQDMADAMHVSVRTIIRWQKVHESFGEACSEGKDAADGKVERCLYERATGYDYVEEESIVEVDPESGEQKPVRVKRNKRHVPPDTGAMCFWLKNRKRNDWRDRPDMAYDNNDDRADIQIYLPDNGRGDSDE